MEVTKDELKAMAREGKLPKGSRPWRGPGKTEEAADPIQTLADAAAKTTEESGKVMQITSKMVEATLSLLVGLKEAPITVNVPESKGPKDWQEIEVSVTDRDFQGRIHKVRMRRVA
jgi:hypothetical protein